MIHRHSPALVGAAAALVLLSAVPAHATDLGEYLERADEAVYSGREMVVTVWNGVTRVDLVDVEHALGTTMVQGDHVRATVGRGRLRFTGTKESALTFVEWTPAVTGARYTLTAGTHTRRLGRLGEVVELSEGGRRRVRMILDVETGAPLLTEVFDGEGRVFRYAAMVEFSPSTAGMAVPTRPEGEYEVMVPLASPHLPETAGAYHRMDSYRGPAGSEQGFYSDGLFSFSLFAFDGERDVRAMVRGMPYRRAGAEYTVQVAAAELWVLWAAAGQTYVLVGDLPPDHLDAVLADLPRPSARNLLARLWHGLFG